MINLRALFVNADRRATEPHALFAAAAFLRVYRKRGANNRRLHKHTRAAANDRARLVRRQLLAQHSLQRVQIARIDYPYAPNAYRFANLFKTYRRHCFHLKRKARRRILLMPRHARDRVVENQNRRAALIVRDVRKTRDAGMQECRVADNADRPIALRRAYRRKSVQRGNRRAHAYARVERAQRRRRAQRVTADVAQHCQFHLAQRVKHAAMRATCAHYRRSRRNRFAQRDGFRLGHVHCAANCRLRKLAQI